VTIRERLEAFWSGEQPDRIPYTIYYWEWYRANGGSEDATRWQALFDRGLGVTQHVGTVRQTIDDSHHETETSERNGLPVRRIHHHTSVGSITAEWVDNWHTEYWLKTADDYRVMTHIVNNTYLEAGYEPFQEFEQLAEPWRIPLASFGRTPIQTILVDLVGLENFGLHLATLLDPMMELYEALLERCRERAQIMAAGPGRYVAFMENFTSETLGPRRYADWILPVYEEIIPLLQQSGKVVGTHYDGQVGHCLNEIQRAPMDLIESFTPPPEGDLTLAQARVAFPEKLLWSNINVSLYELPADELAAIITQRVADGAPDGRRLAFEVSEQWPHNWATSMPVVLDTLNGIVLD